MPGACGSRSARWSRAAPPSFPSCSTAPTACCGRWPWPPRWCRSSIASCRRHGTRGRRRAHDRAPRSTQEVSMRYPLLTLLLVSLAAPPAHSFCGFFVASGDAKLFNHASRVALVRDGDRTVITMSNDFKGDPTRFAMVVPVPTVLEKGQVHVGDRALLDHLDAYSAPRL